jgi:hypothetical protein
MLTAPDTCVLPSGGSGDRHVIVQAKPHRLVRLGMVARRSNQR